MKPCILGFAALSGLTLALPAFAQQEACAPREQIVQKLANDFKEQQQAVGYVNDKAVLEVFVSGTGSWTIIATGTDGNSCVVSAGEDWDEAGVVKGLDSGFNPTASDADLIKPASH